MKRARETVEDWRPPCPEMMTPAYYHTDQHPTAANARQQLRSQIRKNHIQTFLAAGRQQLTIALQDAHFQHITSSIDANTFRTHLSLLVRWANTERYGHRVVMLAGFAYEELVRCPDDAEVLDLVASLAQFDELELPHTKQLADILISNLQYHPVEALSVIAQVLANTLGDRFAHYLLERGLLANSEVIAHCEKDQQTFLWTDTLSSLLSTRPSLPLSAINFISSILANIANSSSSLLVVDSLAKISQFSSKDSQISRILLQNLGQLCRKEYPEQSIQICSFYHYCVLSGSILPEVEIQLLAQSFENKREDCKLAILSCLTDLWKSDTLSNLEDIFLSTALPFKVLQLYESSSFSLKKPSIIFLEITLPSFLELTSQDQTFSHFDLAASFEIFMSDALYLHDTPSQQTALSLLLSILLTLQEMQSQQREPFLAGFSYQSLSNWLTEPSLCQTKQGLKTMKKIERVLQDLRK